MRTKASIYNIIAQMTYYLVNIFLGMVNRKVLLNVMGVEYQGINGLFSNVLSMLSLAELGIGTAIIYHLYRPVKENDINKVKSLMRFYKKCYMAIFLVVLFFGIVVLPFLPFFIGDNQLDISFNVVYLLMIGETLASYVFTYKRSLLYAQQKNYYVFVGDTLYLLVAYVSQIMIIVYTQNYYLYLLSKVIYRVIENIILNIVVNKMYPYLKDRKVEKIDRGVLDDIKLKVKGSIFHKIGAYIVYGTDNILVSKFVGLSAVGIYSNYSLIITSVTNIFAQAVTSVTASVGNLLTFGDDKKNYEVYKELQIMNAAVINFTATSLLCLLSPFVKLFFGSEYQLSEEIVWVLVINYCWTGMRKVYGVFKDAAGIQYEDRFVPVVEATINLFLSIVFAKSFGMIGVFIGTTCSYMCIYFYTFPFIIFRKVLKQNVRDYVFELAKYFGLFFLSMIVTSYIVRIVNLENYLLTFIIDCVICLVIPNGIFLLVFHRNESFVKFENRIRCLLTKK